MYPLLKLPLFAYSHKDPEKAHLLAIKALKLLQTKAWALHLVRSLQSRGVGSEKGVDVCGIPFPNRIGLAAGFDKHGEVAPALEALGFGFAELGTATPKPQPGNPRPRVWRIPYERGIVNAMGFNSYGADVFKRNFAENASKVTIPIGISAGKNKDTPLEDAAQDYISVIVTLAPYGHYIVANISSPNTPGLRELQGGRYLEALVKAIIQAEKECRARLNLPPRPFFAKIAPDMNDRELDETLEALTHAGANGIIPANTTITKPRSIWARNPDLAERQAGFSGPRTLFSRACFIERICTKAPIFDVVGVGGIRNGGGARMLLDSGAKAVQIYTGLIWEGPGVVRDIRMELAK